MKRFTHVLAGLTLLAAGTGCCMHQPFGGGYGGGYGAGYGGGCQNGNCGYGPGAYNMGTQMQAGVPIYGQQAAVPYYGPQAAIAPYGAAPVAGTPYYGAPTAMAVNPLRAY